MKTLRNMLIAPIAFIAAIFTIVSCDDIPKPVNTMPTIDSLSAVEVERTSALLVAQVTRSKEGPYGGLREAGIYFFISESRIFEQYDSIVPYVSSSSGRTERYTERAHNLKPGTTYYYKFFIQNFQMEGYPVISSEVKSFTTASRLAQTLQWDYTTDYLYVGGETKFSARSSAKLPVKYRIVEGNDLVEFHQYYIYALKTGTVVVEAYQDGNDTYAAAEPITMKFEIMERPRKEQTLKWVEVTDNMLLGESFHFSAQASSYLGVSYRIIDGKSCASMENGNVHAIKAGVFLIEAYQDGNNDYLPAKPIRMTVEVTDGSLSGDVIVTPWEPGTESDMEIK